MSGSTALAPFDIDLRAIGFVKVKRFVYGSPPPIHICLEARHYVDKVSMRLVPVKAGL